MELDIELKDYIIKHYRYLLSKKEHDFYHKLLLEKKDSLNADEFINTIKKLDFAIVHNKGGLEEYVYPDVATYLLEKYPEDIFINRCPKCNGLARTPHAKQCPHCFHSWHNQ